MGERGIGDTDAVVRSVIDGIKPLEPGLSVDKVQPLARVAPEITDNDVDFARSPADGGVQRARPDLTVGCELKRGLSNGFEQSTERFVNEVSPPFRC